MDKFEFLKAGGRSFLHATGTRTLLVDVDEIGRIWGTGESTTIALTSGSCEVIYADASELADGFVKFLSA